MDIFRIERGTHFSIGLRELSGQSPEIDAVFAVEGFDPETVLLVVMISAEANAEDVAGTSG
jgi:hypothetical protein